jgi:formylglycine-generating enzyme required for sulfatase activity
VLIRGIIAATVIIAALIAGGCGGKIDRDWVGSETGEPTGSGGDDGGASDASAGSAAGVIPSTGGMVNTAGAANAEAGGSDPTSAHDCPEGMALVAAGDFLMGSEETEGLSLPDEFPRHRVSLSAYCIDVNETTNAEYQACEQAGDCSPPRAVEPPSGYGDPTLSSRPVPGVSWAQAQTYCAWQSKRLPTEAEWEKAARGGAPDVRLHPWGDRYPDPDELRWCPQDTDVGQPTIDISPFGVRDLVSGAPEWVSDWYDADYYAVSPAIDPKGPVTGSQHVVRGALCAACIATLHSYRVSRRLTCAERPIDAIGIRCAKDVRP